MILNIKGYEVIVREGDRCHVKSERFNKYFTDGVISEIYQGYLKVSYGFSEYFGSSFTRGNTKTIPKDEIHKLLRFPDANVIKPASECLPKEDLAALMRRARR